jgi:hypothetical protein
MMAVKIVDGRDAGMVELGKGQGLPAEVTALLCLSIEIQECVGIRRMH